MSFNIQNSTFKICIIGSGNIATFYATCFVQNGYSIVQVVSPNEEHAKVLAQKCNCSFETHISKLVTHADIYFLAVKDDVLLDYAQQLSLKDKIVLYAAGSVSIEKLLPISEKIICLWSVFSIQKNNLPTHKNIPLSITVSNENLKPMAQHLANAISDVHYFLEDKQKEWVHLTAVLVNNFTNHLFDLSYQLLAKNNIDFSILKPIMLDTVLKLNESIPSENQTGPAIRNDLTTIKKHLQLLENEPENVKEVYETLTKSIQSK